MIVGINNKPQHPFTYSLNKETRVFLWRFSALQASSEDSLNFERAPLKIQRGIKKPPGKKKKKKNKKRKNEGKDEEGVCG
jgi:hypothetical protein